MTFSPILHLLPILELADNLQINFDRQLPIAMCEHSFFGQLPSQVATSN